VAGQDLAPDAGQRDLPDRGGRLAVLQLERAARQLEHRAAECDGARGHDQDLAPVLVQAGDILHQ
jgi:hypothetical protein